MIVLFKLDLTEEDRLNSRAARPKKIRIHFK
jgi:hypothetical protein